MTPGSAAARLEPRSRASNAEFNPPLDTPFRVDRAWRDGHVRRRALVRRLSDSRHASVAAIVAPPGYGKSTLISEWSGHDARPFLWPGIDESAATDLGATASAILATLEQGGWLDARGKRKTRPDPLADLRAALRALRARGQAFVLVVDDAHRVAPDVLRGLTRVMIEESPSGATLAVASRSELPLPLGRLRASRTLVEV